MTYRLSSGVRLAAAVTLILAASSAAIGQTPDAVETAEAALDRQAYQAALDILQPLEASGDMDAASVLAHMYRRGLGVPQNYVRAAELDGAAARRGVARSQNAFGHALIEGFGVTRDRAAGLQWLTRAAETGNPDYQFDLGSALMRAQGPDYRSAARWYDAAAQQGHVEAKTNLGLLYLQGTGVPEDPAEAQRLFREAAQAGDAQAQNNLGLLYVRGIGIEQDYAQAAAWFSLAAEQGLAEGMRNLSVLHESGYGMPVNEDAARALLSAAREIEMGNVASLVASLGVPFDDRLVEPDWRQPLDPAENAAALAGDTIALYRTAFRFLGGLGVRQDNREGRERLERAAGQGSRAAALNLCLLYANGSGVPQSYRTALVWCSLASYLGQTNAAVIRDRLILALPPEVVASAQQEVEDRLVAAGER